LGSFPEIKLDMFELLLSVKFGIVGIKKSAGANVFFNEFIISSEKLAGSIINKREIINEKIVFSEVIVIGANMRYTAHIKIIAYTNDQQK
jgi:hypothetical protein